MRQRDMRGYAESLGLSIGSMQLHSFIMAPIRHQGMHIGSFFLANKESAEEFANEDEEVVAMFASLAALVIANARRYRDEQRGPYRSGDTHRYLPGGRRCFRCQDGSAGVVQPGGGKDHG